MEHIEGIKLWARDYSRGNEPKPFEHEGITYYWVGHNASHSYALGVAADGQIWKYVEGEDGWDEATDSPTWKSYSRLVGDFRQVGYCGHF